jgi:hypothetical protein
MWRADLSAGSATPKPSSNTTASSVTTSSSPADPKPEPAVEVSMRAFREGWTLLRASKHRDAIAAFDRATDPVVAEDAVFWAAVAAERASDRADAARRYADFVTRFPASPRIEAARTAVKRLAP